MMIKLTNLIIAAILFCLPVFAQESNRPLGWDLSYSSVLETNKIGSNEWLRKWLASGYQSPAKKWISEWQGEPIVSSVLIEYPAFHAAEHTTEWFVRTENNAFYWRIVEDDAEPDVEKKYFTLQAYDDLFREVSSWQQAVPRKGEDLPPGMPPNEIDLHTGYIGFLSSYEKGRSRQMLLSMEDFVICNGKKCTPESQELKSGRVLRALADLPKDPRCWEKEYKPKSKAELAAMPPRQLIDELIKSTFVPYDIDKRFDYISSIQIEIHKASLEVLPVLTEYMNAYKTQSDSECDESRFFVAQKTAVDIDESEIRLRGTKEGQQTIDAFERAIERMEKTRDKKKTSDYRNLDLKQLKGVNSFDGSIQDTFWVNKKIKISDGEMLEFSNFLTARGPKYPSWSDKDLIRDYSRINEAGNPAQVNILKKPQCFYEAFAEFKKIRPQNPLFETLKSEYILSQKKDPFRDKTKQKVKILLM